MTHNRDHIVIHQLIEDPRTTSDERSKLEAIAARLGDRISLTDALAVSLITLRVLRRS